MSENHLSGDVSHSEHCIMTYLFIHPLHSVGYNFMTAKGLREQMLTGFMDLFKSLCDNCTSCSSVLMPSYLKYWIPSEENTFSLTLDVGQTLYSCTNEYRPQVRSLKFR